MFYATLDSILSKLNASFYRKSFRRIAGLTAANTREISDE
jgi:hypothetical protein